MSTTVLLELLDGLKYKSGAAISHALATISDKGEVGNLIELIEKADIDHKKQLKLVGDKKFRNGAFIGSTTVSIVMLLTGGIIVAYKNKKDKKQLLELEKQEVERNMLLSQYKEEMKNYKEGNSGSLVDEDKNKE